MQMQEGIANLNFLRASQQQAEKFHWGLRLGTVKMKLPGLILVVLAIQGVASNLDPSCVQKVGQVLCSIHHPDQLSLCLRGVNEKTVFLNEAIESYCFTEDPDHCVTQKLCSVKVNDGGSVQATTTSSTPEPQVG